MKQLSLVLSIAVLTAGCAAQAGSIERVQAGMNQDQVRSIMGPPETIAYAPGKECAYYSVLKDFWARTPWSLSHRYYVCYDSGKVESFGRVDAAPVA